MIAHPNVKINLGLNILRKREDGFHDIETLFVPYYGITDTLEINKADETSLTSAKIFSHYRKKNQVIQDISDDAKLLVTIAKEEGVDWEPLKDLTVKAYRILAEDYPDLPPVKIFLEKTSPVGAGLGGGSADAAFALKLIDELCDLRLSLPQLAVYAAKLGSDCAFFVYNTPMFGEGRGDILSPFEIPELENYELRIEFIKGTSVSTAQAYAGVKPHMPQIPLREVLSMPVSEWKHYLVNDFEKSVFELRPVLADVKQKMYDAGAVYASMSGSGSAIFGLFRKD